MAFVYNPGLLANQVVAMSDGGLALSATTRQAGSGDAGLGMQGPNAGGFANYVLFNARRFQVYALDWLVLGLDVDLATGRVAAGADGAVAADLARLGQLKQPVHGPAEQADGAMAAGTAYLKTGGSTATEADAWRFICPKAGVISGLRTESKQGATGTLAITVRKGGVDTALKVAATAGTGAVQTLNDLANSFTVAAGDVLTIKAVGTTVASAVKALSFLYSDV